MVSDLMNYIVAHLDDRLKSPFVSKDYTPQEKKHLLTGLQTALACKEINQETIIEIHKMMNPDIQKKMRSSIRRAGVGMIFSTCKKEGLLETLNWLEKHQAGYGPRFTIVKTKRKDFINITELRQAYGCETNNDLALILELELKDEKTFFHIIPIFDSLNPLIDSKLTSPYELDDFQEYEKDLKEQGYLTYDVVAPTFFQLVDEFNQLKQPSLKEIANFIKSMILLHPFPNGNARTFVLGVLNALLYSNNYGLCLHLNPYDIASSTIASSTSVEIANDILKNLIPLEQCVSKKKLAEKSGLIVRNYSARFFQQGSLIESNAERGCMPDLG